MAISGNIRHEVYNNKDKSDEIMGKQNNKSSQSESTYYYVSNTLHMVMYF